jgi:hypothetical protein
LLDSFYFENHIDKSKFASQIAGMQRFARYLGNGKTQSLLQVSAPRVPFCHSFLF